LACGTVRAVRAVCARRTGSVRQIDPRRFAVAHLEQHGFLPEGINHQPKFALFKYGIFFFPLCRVVATKEYS
jgi:hypothetical protein